MSATSPSKEKFCSLLSEIIDKSKDIIVETEDVLEYDAVELTLLLKSVGFRLISLDFDCVPNEETKDIEIEIKCKQSGIHSKMVMQSNKCTCPSRKSVNNNSFWEVQGIEPATLKTQGIVQDTSCNLLPDITRRTANIARTILTVLLQHYQTDFEQKGEKTKTLDVKQILERLQEKSFNSNKVSDVGNDRTIEGLDSEFQEEMCNSNKTTVCSTPLSSINITPVPLHENMNAFCGPKIVHFTNPNELDTENSSENEKPIEESEKESNISSPKNEVPPTSPAGSGSNFDKLYPDSDRDVCLIKAITGARKQLDSALLVLKCNATRELSHGTLLVHTPQNSKKVRKPLTPQRFTTTIKRRLSVDNIEVNRRHSTGARLENKATSPNKVLLKNSSSVNSITEVKKKSKENNALPVNKKNPKTDVPKPVGVSTKKATEKIQPALPKIVIRRASSASSLKTNTLKLQMSKANTKMSNTKMSK